MRLRYDDNPRGRTWLAHGLVQMQENQALRRGKRFVTGNPLSALMAINSFFEIASEQYTFEDVCSKQHLIYEAYEASLEWDAGGDPESQKTIDDQREKLIFMDCLIGMVRQEMKKSVSVPREPMFMPLWFPQF